MQRSVALLIMPFGASPSRAEPTFEVIHLNDLASSLTVHLIWTFHAIGIDPNDNVYVVFGGPDGKSTNCAMFQYNSKTGARRLIGTLADAAKRAGTFREGERIEKGHTPLPCVDGRIYIGTMPFHDATAGWGDSMDVAEKSHGAHLMMYDPETDRIDDLSKDEPDGVFFPHCGFMCLNLIPGTKYLAAMTVPQGDILVYDTAKKKRHVSVPGVPEELGRSVCREIAPAPNGKIYYQYGSAEWNALPGHMYYCDMNTGERSAKPIDIEPYLWNGIVRTDGGKNIYLCCQQGYLYQLHYATNSVEKIGCLFPESERKAVEEGGHQYAEPHVMGMVLSADEKSIYSIPLRQRSEGAKPATATEKLKVGRNAQAPLGLYRFDLATRKAERVCNVPESVGEGFLSGTNIRDSQGNFYFAHHGNYLGLVKVSLGK